MGTRSLTVFKDETDVEICVMYRQFDGYPEGHGKSLALFLEPFIIVNGIKPNTKDKIANGMGCLTAQVIAAFKKEPGSIYVHAAGTRDVGEEYIYMVSGSVCKNPMIEVYEVGRDDEIVFHGSAATMVKWLEAEEAEREAEADAEKAEREAKADAEKSVNQK